MRNQTQLSLGQKIFSLVVLLVVVPLAAVIICAAYTKPPEPVDTGMSGDMLMSVIGYDMDH